MDSTADDASDLDELLALTRQFRGQLERRIRLGGWAAPGTPSARLELSELSGAQIDEIAPEVESLPQMLADAVGGVAMREVLRAPIGEPVIPLGRRTLPQIRADLGECMRCKLHTTRKSIVFGVGAEDAPLMFVGEAPGEQEDRRGEPFVGPAGELLDRMVEAMGWTRQSIYIGNTLKCRPPGNRNPQPDELEQCLPFLRAQIASVAPRIIVALGRPAANQLLGTDAPISALRGRFHDRHGTKVMPTFHPAYLLREPDRKRDVWSDLKLVIAELARLGIQSPNPPRN
jgi:DNA polymerase